MARPIEQPDGLRKCYNCLEIKTLDQFYSHRGKPKGLAYMCKPCSRRDKLTKGTPESRTLQQRKTYLKGRYGLTMDDWDKMSKEQDGGCLICTNRDPLVVDHDHDTGEVRGLLCNNCNAGLGMFKDNDLLLIAAGRYISSQN